MKRNITLWQLMGFAVTAFLGTVLHFLYDFFDGASFIAPFSAVNESTWEHMKLLFWPMFIYAVIQSFFFRGNENFWCIKLKGITLGLALIPIIFYTYNGVFGRSPDWINISIFFIAAAATYIYEAIKLNKEKRCCKSPKLAFIMLCVIALLFVVFSFAAPSIEIFKDPLTN